MNKLVTVFSALAVAAGIAQGEVKSANIVGYTTRAAEGYTCFVPGFQKVGGGTTTLNDLLDENTLTAYVDEVQIYDPVEGLFVSWIWDGTGWTDWTGTQELEIAPGEGYFANFTLDQNVCGEVVNSDTLAFTHEVPTGYSALGSAFPTAMVASNFNFAQVLTAYVDEVQIYDPVEGVFVSWTWDGTGFTDWSTYLPDVMAPQGEGVFFGNISGFTELVETL